MQLYYCWVNLARGTTWRGRKYSRNRWIFHSMIGWWFSAPLRLWAMMNKMWKWKNVDQRLGRTRRWLHRPILQEIAGWRQALFGKPEIRVASIRFVQNSLLHFLDINRSAWTRLVQFPCTVLLKQFWVKSHNCGFTRYQEAVYSLGFD